MRVPLVTHSRLVPGMLTWHGMAWRDTAWADQKERRTDHSRSCVVLCCVLCVIVCCTARTLHVAFCQELEEAIKMDDDGGLITIDDDTVAMLRAVPPLHSFMHEVPKPTEPRNPNP